MSSAGDTWFYGLAAGVGMLVVACAAVFLCRAEYEQMIQENEMARSGRADRPTQRPARSYVGPLRVGRRDGRGGTPVGYVLVKTGDLVGGRAPLLLSQPLRANVDPVSQLTFFLSIIVQTGAFTLGVVASVRIAQDEEESPPILSLVLLLENIVQAVELTWYALVGLYHYLVIQREMPVYYRYMDWVLTTPTMLLHTMFFTVWLKHAWEPAFFLVDEAGKVAAIPVVVVLDWAMLFVGLVYETRWASLQWAMKGLDRVWGINAGFLFLVGAFVPLSVTLGTHYTDDGLALLLSMFVVWVFYGAVAGVYERQPHIRNTCYNLLDVASKNVFGVILSAIALNKSWPARA